MTDSWYTPPDIIDLALLVMGEIDLDPCAEPGKRIPANQHYTIEDDGLRSPWHGRIFMNPPYSEPGIWTNKFIEETESGKIPERGKNSGSILLLPAAVGTAWFQRLWLYTDCCVFWKGRIKFLDSGYKPRNTGRFDSALIYIGGKSALFAQTFVNYGIVVKP